MKILYVEWIDAWGTRSDGWMPREDRVALMEQEIKRSARTVGFVLKETGTDLYLTSSYDGDDVDFCLVIPRPI